MTDFVTADEYNPSKSSSKAVRNQFDTITNSSEPLMGYVTKAELRVLKTVLNMMKQKIININGKLLSSETGYSKSYMSEILTSLRKKNLIETAKQESQKIHRLTLEGAMAVKSANAPPSDFRTIQGKKIKVRVRPHDFRFRAEILRGDPFNDMTFKKYRMKGMLGGVIKYEYDQTCIFQKSQKTGKRWVEVYIKVFFTDDLKLCKVRAHEKAVEILRYLKKDFRYEFSDLILTHSHIALTNEPVSLSAENGTYVKSRTGRVAIDCSEGQPEFEGLTKYGQEDLETFFQEVVDPVVEGKYSLLTMLKHLQLLYAQIKTDQLIFSQNERLMAKNMKEHLELTTAIKEAGQKVDKASGLLLKTFERYLEKQEKERERSKRSIFKKIRESGQKFMEDYL